MGKYGFLTTIVPPPVDNDWFAVYKGSCNHQKSGKKCFKASIFICFKNDNMFCIQLLTKLSIMFL